MMALFLGIDGGGSGCRAAVADAGGTILGRGEGGPANINTNTTEAHGNLMAATRMALAQAVGPENVAQAMPLLHAALGVAGANVPESAARLRGMLPFATVQIVSDAVSAVKGALRDEDGIVVAIGTGSVFAAQRGGVLHQFGGWGFALGDEAGGAWMGRAALAMALRACDGLGDMTPLLQHLIAAHGGTAGVVSFATTARPADYAALAPQIIGSDDPAARAIRHEAEGYIVAMVDGLQKGAGLPVAFLGGIGPHFAPRLAGRWPLHTAYGSGLDGALWLARNGGS